MKRSTAVVITSISPPNNVLRSIAKGCRANGIEYIVVGDRKSPADFRLDGCNYLSLAQQKELPLNFAKLCPESHYSRKNIGYLWAMKAGHTIIVETDDDNIPYDAFWYKRHMELEARVIQLPGWFNAYSGFTKEYIWPRGFPLQFVQEGIAKQHSSLHDSVISPIQQGLADDNPDVDAVYRMLMPLPVKFEKNDDIFLSEGTWCPFNSQNTTWFKEAFPLMYLPSHCSFRMTDIWRSFVAQRVAWTCNWGVLFHSATVYQERNTHSLPGDFRDEVPGYLHNANMCDSLAKLDLKEGVDNVVGNIMECYRLLIREKYIGQEEMSLLTAWLEDVAVM